MLKVYVVFSILCLGLTASLLSSNGGLSELLYLEKEIKRQQEQLNQQILQNQALENHIVVLQNKPEAIETIAREQLGLVKPGEVFIEVIDYRNLERHLKPLPIADSLKNESQTATSDFDSTKE